MSSSSNSLKSSIPQNILPDLEPAHIEDWQPFNDFLSLFYASMYVYLEEADKSLNYPTMHAKAKLDLDKQKEGYGCFISVNGFKTPDKRDRANLASLNTFFVDIDYPHDDTVTHLPSTEELAAFKRDALESVCALESDGFMPTGVIETKNGYHVYWFFDEPIILDNITKPKRTDADGRTGEDGEPIPEVDHERVEALLKTYREVEEAIIKRFQGDPNAKDVSRILRVPNTWHLKDKNDPFLVKIVYLNVANRYAFKALKNYFLGPSGKSYAKFDEWASNTLTETASPLLWKHASGAVAVLTPEILNELAREYPKVERPSIIALMQKEGRGAGSRNHSLLIAASALRESGWPESQTLSFFDHYNGLSLREIQSTIKSAYERAEPYEFGWNHPLVASHVTEAERARVSSFVSTRLKESAREKRELAKAKKELREEKLPEQIQIDAYKDESKLKREAAKTEAADKAYQKSLYKQYENDLIRKLPGLRFMPSVGFYLFEDGVYHPLHLDDLRGIIVREKLTDGLLDYRTESGVRNKILCLQSKEAIQISADESAAFELLNVKNGLLNVRTLELSPHTPDIFLTTRVPATWEPTADLTSLCPGWLRFIEEISGHDKTKGDLLQQIGGYCLTQNTSYQKAFIFFGPGSNGKSTFIDEIKALLGSSASSLTLRDIQSPFGLAGLFGKRLNITEEIDHNYVESDQIKKAITGSELTANRKFLEPVVFRPYAKFIFLVNSLPKINDVSHGLYRRFEVIPFTAKFPVNPEFAEQFKKERDGILKWCIEGYQLLLRLGAFMLPEDVKAANEDFKEANSPLVEFFLRTFDLLSTDNPDNYPLDIIHVFHLYQSYCRDMGYSAKSLQSFVREVTGISHTDLKNIIIVNNGKTKFITGIKIRPQVQQDKPPSNTLY